MIATFDITATTYLHHTKSLHARNQYALRDCCSQGHKRPKEDTGWGTAHGAMLASPQMGNFREITHQLVIKDMNKVN